MGFLGPAVVFNDLVDVAFDIKCHGAGASAYGNRHGNLLDIIKFVKLKSYKTLYISTISL